MYLFIHLKCEGEARFHLKLLRIYKKKTMFQTVTECALAEPKFGSILHITSSNPILNQTNMYILV